MSVFEEPDTTRFPGVWWFLVLEGRYDCVEGQKMAAVFRFFFFEAKDRHFFWERGGESIMSNMYFSKNVQKYYF